MMHLPSRRSTMPSHFWHSLAYTTVLFVTISLARGVSVDSVVLAGGGRYAQLHAPAVLHCPHTPLEGAALEKLGWFKESVPVMTWAPPDAPVASVEYHDRLNASVVDGSLALLEVSANDGGAYTCTVQTSDGKQSTSDPYHLTVADVPSFGFSMQGNVADCTLHFSFSSPPIYPKPTPLCGVWSTDTLYTGTATDWQAVPYYNGSVAYSIVDTTFPVRGMPLQAGIRCELSFPPAEGTDNDDRVVAWTNTAYYPQVSERGCPPLEVGDGIATHYTNHRTTCRGELAPQDPSKQLVAMISCMTGKRSSLRGGAMGSLQLQCTGGQQWEPVGGVSWDEFENMECTDDLDSEHDDESIQQLSQPDDLQEYEDQESPVAEPNSGAAGLCGVTTATAAALVLALLM